MPELQLPINGNPYENVDQMQLGDSSPMLRDGYVDELGHTHKRPGLTATTQGGGATWSTTYPIQGLFFDQRLKLLFNFQRSVSTVGSSYLARMTESVGGTYPFSQNRIELGGEQRVIETNNGTYHVFANGMKPVYTDLSTVDGTTGIIGSILADTDTPSQCSHVAFLDNYIIANELGTGRFWWCDVGDVESWNALNFATAEGKPDNIVALMSKWREILLLGTESAEIWHNDGVTPFIRTEGAFIERGSNAPYTLTSENDTYQWLDEKRNFITVTGRTPAVVSQPVYSVLQGYAKTDDAYSVPINIAGHDWILLNFPTGNDTLVYRPSDKTWHGHWGRWDKTNGVYHRWVANCYCYAEPWGKHFIGGIEGYGKVYELSPTTYTDDGDEIRTLRRTGFVDHGTYRRKRSKQVTIKCKMGQGSYSSTTPYLLVRWRDDGGSVWSNERMVDLKQLGSTEFYAVLYNTGIYRSRQWEIVMSDAVPLILCGATEEVELLVS